ncbi:MAG: hypothetical protein MUF36_04200 [Bacteroidales bacterium]|nr:hypothetical protein [Bacteroidales bacterium]
MGCIVYLRMLKARSMGHGAWGMGHGARGMEHGAWSMGHGIDSYRHIPGIIRA